MSRNSKSTAWILTGKEERKLSIEERRLYYQRLREHCLHRKLTHTTPLATKIGPVLKKPTGAICRKVCNLLAGGGVEVVTETDDLIGRLEEYKEIISTIRWELIEEKGLYSRSDVTNMDYVNFVKGNMKNLQMGSIDIELENGRIQSANQDFFKYFHINNIPWDAWGELLETEEKRKIMMLNKVHGI